MIDGNLRQFVQCVLCDMARRHRAIRYKSGMYPPHALRAFHFYPLPIFVRNWTIEVPSAALFERLKLPVLNWQLISFYFQSDVVKLRLSKQFQILMERE